MFSVFKWSRLGSPMCYTESERSILATFNILILGQAGVHHQLPVEHAPGDGRLYLGCRFPSFSTKICKSRNIRIRVDGHRGWIFHLCSRYVQGRDDWGREFFIHGKAVVPYVQLSTNCRIGF